MKRSRADAAVVRSRTDAALVRMHRGPQLSPAALEHTLRDVCEYGMPDRISTSSQRRARTAAAEVPTKYGPVLQALQIRKPDGEDLTVWLSHPLALLHRTVEECPPFKTVLRKQLEKHPCNPARPWGLVIYVDEVTPTDPLSSHEDTKKIQAFYWSFLEFDDYLHDERFWFIVSCATSVHVTELDTGMSALIRHVLKECFFNASSNHLERSGMAIDMREASATEPSIVRLFARHRLTIADFKGLKEVLLSMGQQGVRPCPACANIVKDDRADNATKLALTSVEPHRWKPHTDASIRKYQRYMRDLIDAGLSKTGRQDLETRLGFHYRPESIINDAELQYGSMSTLMFDWPHIYFIGGLFGKELSAFSRTRGRLLRETGDRF